MRTKVAITITPVIKKIAPEVFVSVPGETARWELWETKKFEFEFDHSVGFLQVDLTNKPNDDPVMAVIIDKVEFFGISDPKFIWAGVYKPNYPEPWYSQQINKPPELLPQQSYLGWNGTWRLDFSVPVFTWMHQTLNLGWLYQ